MTGVPESVLRVGTARADITPTDLTALNPMGGSFTSVHDPLQLRAIVLDDGTTQAAVVSLDLIEVGESEDLRRRIQAEVGIPSQQVLLTPTHTHSAPRIGQIPPGGLARAARPASLVYTATVADAIVDALRSAQSRLVPARMAVGRGSADVNVNRDEFIDGGYRLGFNATGPSDKTLRVIAFETLDGGPLAVIVNYAVHSVVTIGIGRVSADLAGAASRAIEQRWGTDAVALWTLGTVADQNPRVSLLDPSEGVSDADAEWAFRSADAQGLIVAGEALRVLSGLDTWDAAPHIRSGEDLLVFPIKRGVNLPADMVQADVPEVGIRLFLLRIGDVALAGVSGELTTVLGQRLRDASPLRDTIPISIANERIGYLSEDEAYSRGTFAAKGTPVQPGHAERGIAEGFARLIAETQT